MHKRGRRNRIPNVCARLNWWVTECVEVCINTGMRRGRGRIAKTGIGVGKGEVVSVVKSKVSSWEKAMTVSRISVCTRLCTLTSVTTLFLFRYLIRSLAPPARAHAFVRALYTYIYHTSSYPIALSRALFFSYLSSPWDENIFDEFLVTLTMKIVR